MSRIRFLVCLISVTLLVSACGGRLPSAKTAQSVAKSYFKGYGRKYKGTNFAGKGVDSILINNIYELHYHTALIDSNVVFRDSPSNRLLITMEKKFPLGWRVKSWEQLVTGGDE